MNSKQKLFDECLELEAALHGKRMELAISRGKRRDAQHHKAQMYGAIRARRAFLMGVAEQDGECFFDAAGRADRAAMGVLA